VLLVVSDALRTRYGLVDIRNGTVAPAPHLVSEQPKTPGPPSPHRAFRDDAVATVSSLGWPLLNHEAPLRQVHDQRRVVEVTALAPVAQRDDCLEEPAVEPDRVTTGAEWQPVQVDARSELSRHKTKDLGGAWSCPR